MSAERSAIMVVVTMVTACSVSTGRSRTFVVVTRDRSLRNNVSKRKVQPSACRCRSVVTLEVRAAVADVILWTSGCRPSAPSPMVPAVVDSQLRRRPDVRRSARQVIPARMIGGRSWPLRALGEKLPQDAKGVRSSIPIVNSSTSSPIHEYGCTDVCAQSSTPVPAFTGSSPLVATSSVVSTAKCVIGLAWLSNDEPPTSRQ